MNVELCYLTMSVALCLGLPFLYVPARVLSWGLKDVVGYPDNPPPVPAWSARLKQAHNNLVENLIPFSCLVLVAEVASISTPLTIFAAALFFWCRVAHELMYTRQCGTAARRRRVRGRRTVKRHRDTRRFSRAASSSRRSCGQAA